MNWNKPLLSLNDEIDKLFAILKDGERIILSERESLALIATLAEQLKLKPQGMDIDYDLVEEIARLSNIRL
jgi:hypothetical protein